MSTLKSEELGQDLDISEEKTDTLAKDFKVLNQAYDPLDLTGAEAEMVISDLTGNNLDTYNSSNYLTISGGLIRLNVPDTIVSAYTWTSAKYRLLITFSNGKKITLAKGNFKLI